MERLLHYVWRNKLYPETGLVTMDEMPITIVDTGIINTDAGPDFFNAKVKIDNTLWVGSVEVHTKASDWYRHGHQYDKSYDGVILHLVMEHDCPVYTTTGQLIPQISLPVPDDLRRNAEWLLSKSPQIPCLSQIGEMPSILINGWVDRLLSERLERKTNDIVRLLEQYQGDWNEVLYIILSRNFGFGINSDAFEWLAHSLPLRYIQKQRGCSSQIESLFLGQAGLLEEEYSCDYYGLLKKEYQFLKHKFNLRPLEKHYCKSLRTRPDNFPYVRLAQLAAVWNKYDILFSHLLNTGDPQKIKELLRVPPSLYWETHYHFRHTSPPKKKVLGDQALTILLINTVVPLLFAYGRRMKKEEYCERAYQLLESLPPEKNHIVNAFSRAGIEVRNACDSQSLIQLKREYCEKNKCLWCRIGFQFLKRIRS